MPVLYKSRLLAFRQCPKRLWLEVHRPQLRQDSSATQANFATGHEVGDLARRLYDLDSDGVFLDRDTLTLDQQLSRTHELLKGKQRIFEAGFRSGFDAGAAEASLSAPCPRWPLAAASAASASISLASASK